ncbi:outer membrane beta-barrel protein [Mesorhizobium xinjiangense]|uniref:outer membrane beta-barrel protein n=1 Tax=Mesorhizobium xinjiangense TaxID=2678685 RepID=UPI0018DDACE0|nr:outer membrane beta-barrel protein [Mesorhizobium xinjiangense]
MPLLCAATAAAVLCPIAAANAQALVLRGGIDELAVTGSLLADEPLTGRGSALAGDKTPVRPERPAASGQNYQPISQGATAEDAAEPQRSDPPDRDAAVPTARPRTTDTASLPDEIQTAATNQDRTELFDDRPAQRTPRENRRVAAISGRAPQREAEPYAPLGLRIGNFDVFGELDQGAMWTSNVDSSPTGGEGVVSETALRLTAVSDWTRHSARLEAQGLWRESVSGASLSEFYGDARGALELDLTSDFALRAGLGYAVRPESASSPVEIVGIASQPTVQTLSAELGLEKRAGRHRFNVTGSVERDIYSDADLSTGGTLSQDDRNSTLALLSLRAGYEVSPALIPFVEADIGRRFYDQRTDDAGYQRSGDQYGLAAGLEWNFGEKLNGEFSAGWVEERFDDDRLKAISGPGLAAAVDWSPHRGTSVELSGTTIVEGSTTPGESGSILYEGLVVARREIRANLDAEAGLGAAWRDYSDSSDHELRWLARTGGTWWLNRYAGLDGRLEYERFTSTLPGRDYRTASLYLGLKLQR